MKKPALLIIDMQMASYRGKIAALMDAAAERINRAAELFRAKKLPVVWIQQDNGTDSRPGMPKFEMIASLTKPLPGEKMIVKRYQNSFVKTDLASYLAEQGAGIPIVSGYCAEYCVLASYRGAEELDLKPLLLKDGIASGRRKNKLFVENMLEILSLRALEQIAGNF